MLPLAELVRGDLRELVHTRGMLAIATMLEQERTELCGQLVRGRNVRSRAAQHREPLNAWPVITAEI